MAAIVRFVNTASTPGGDGTTNNTTGATRAYASQVEMEAAEQADLPSAGDTFTGICSGGLDSAAVTYSGWTTGASNDILITTTDDRHDGVFDTNKYFMDIGTSANEPISISEEFVSVIGLQFRRDSLAVSSGARSCVVIPAGVATGLIKVEQNIFKSVASDITGIVSAMSADDSSPNYTFKNNIVYDFNGTNDCGVCGSGSGAAIDVYNNTFINVTNGVSSRANYECINNVFQDCANDISGTVNASNNYNLTDNVSIPGANSVTSSTLTFENKASDNFALVVGDTDAIGAGIGPSADANVPTEDIIGTARSGATTDIGAFVFVGGGGGVTGTITQTTESFTQSSAGTVVNQFTGVIVQTASSFTQSAAGSFTSADFTGVINQTVSSFTQSATGNFTEIISGTINQTASSFTQALVGSVVSDTTGIINVTFSAFTQSANGVVPIPVITSDGLVGSGSLGLGVSGLGFLGGGINGSGNI